MIRRELVVDPADQVPVGDVPDEQVQAVGQLVQPTVPEPMGWQRAAVEVVRLGAGAAGLFVAAAMKLPVVFQLRAAGAAGKLGAEVLPGRPAVALHVVVGDLVRDPLVAQP